MAAASATVAAALFGEGMSSPLMDQIRERRGLVYYAACSADVLELCGQFVIEASTSPQQLQQRLLDVRYFLILTPLQTPHASIRASVTKSL